MLNLKKALKPYTETGALNEQINLYGFVDPHAFLTKSGDVGVILQVHGVDYECLDGNSLDTITKRLESAFRLFDSNFRVYQYAFKRNHETIPHKKYANPIVNTAIENRIRYFEQKADTLYSLQVFYVVLFEGFHRQQAVLRSLAEFPKNPWKAFAEIRAALSSRKQVALLDTGLSKALATLNQKVKSFILQVSDFVRVELLPKQEAFRVMKRTLNFAPLKLELARLKHDTFLDYYLCESHLECHRGHLRLDDYYLKVLSLKEPSAQSFPLIFKSLLEVRANFHIVTEWKKEDSGKTRKAIQSKRRHFHNTKRSLLSHLNVSDAPATDVLVDDSKEAQVRELGESIKQLEIEGNYFGHFSLSVVIYDLDPAKVETACAEFYKVFSVHDAQLYEEKYNLLNAFLGTVPGGSAFNLRSMYLLNTNYADYSFLFTLHCGEPENAHLREEYLAVLETNHNTPYFLNLHHRDVAHTMILGRTGSGKSFLLNFLITNMQKYDPYTFIFDLGGSFESLTRLFGGTYVRVGLNSPGFKINPFSIPPTKENLDFLALFLKVLIQGSSPLELTPAEERDLYHQIENLYEIEPALRTLTVLSNTLDRRLADRLAKWTTGGQFDFVFDNAEDTITFSRFQCFDFQGMNPYPEVLEPLLFYILHRANAVICDPEISSAQPDVNEAQIAALQNRIQALQREQQTAITQQNKFFGSLPSGTQTSATAQVSGTAPEPAPPDPVQEERKRRAYVSLFSSNVALSYRKELAQPQQPSPTAQAQNETTGLPNLPAQRLDLNQLAQILSPMPPQPPLAGVSTAVLQPRNQQAGNTTTEKKEKLAPETSSTSQPLDRASGKTYVLFEGTLFETVLLNRLDGDFAGPIECLVTNDIYSHDRQHLLIPSGTKVLGEAKRVDTFGQTRLAVAFHRLIMPDGYSVSLDRFKGMNQIGDTGLRDKVNNHYFKIFGASLAVGAIGGIAEAGSGGVLTQSGTQSIQQGVGESMGQTSQRILDKFLNILPTVTIREGQRVKIYLSSDLALPDYANHKMPADL